MLNCTKLTKNNTNLQKNTTKNVFHIQILSKKNFYNTSVKKPATQNSFAVSVFSNHQNAVSVTSNSLEISFHVMWLHSQPIRFLQITNFQMCDFKFFFLFKEQSCYTALLKIGNSPYWLPQVANMSCLIGIQKGRHCIYIMRAKAPCQPGGQYGELAIFWIFQVKLLRLDNKWGGILKLLITPISEKRMSPQLLLVIS